jgi:ATP-dependent RNA helicase DHX57
MKTPEGYVSAVILRAIHPKTREKTTLPPVKFPKQHQEIAAQETAVEARHFAATYALFRVSSMKNLHMMMPPKFKDLWKGIFQDLKKEDEKEGRAWMYAADPFQIQRDREEAVAAAAKKREELEKQRAKERAQPGAPGRALLGSKDSRQKGWTRAPKVDMGKRTRIEVERLIRQHSVWNPQMTSIDPRIRDSIIADVVKLGFRKSHAEEAAELCRDKEEILDWLLIHVPEDDLPSWSLPENYTADISLASGDLKREAAIKRLAASGYSMDLCEEAMDSNGGNEAKAAAFLQARLIQNTEVEATTENLTNMKLDDTDSENDMDVWEDEKAVLASIYDERYSSSGDSFKVTIQPEGQSPQIILSARKPFGKYPLVLPIISIEAALPAYIRLAILQQCLQYAEVSFIGEQMVFNIVDWLEHNVTVIIQNPGRLSDVSSAAAAGEAHVVKPQTRQNVRKRLRKRVNWTIGTPMSLRVLEQWRTKQSTPSQQKMLSIRRALPAWSLQDSIVEAVNNHQVTIISGETGSGKSTQSVQFILDDLIDRQLGESVNIICTQPRRISALGLADRVTEERCGRVGEEVGYIIRGESKFKENTTKITFVTTGVLLRRLQTSGGKSEDVVAALADVSHVVVDEVHERSLDTDFLLILLRDVLRARKDLKVILMSATLDADIFEQYFRSVGPVARIEIQGRTHPVQDYYLDDVIRITGFNGHTEEEDVEDEENQKQLAGSLREIGMKINYDFIAQVVRQIDSELGRQEGGILIFLPGTMEIDRTIRVRRLSIRFESPLIHHAGSSKHTKYPCTPSSRFSPPCRAETRVPVGTSGLSQSHRLNECRRNLNHDRRHRCSDRHGPRQRDDL